MPAIPRPSVNVEGTLRRRRLARMPPTHGGGGGIRTHGGLSPTHAFEACSFGRSDTPPRGKIPVRYAGPRTSRAATQPTRPRARRRPPPGRARAGAPPGPGRVRPPRSQAHGEPAPAGARARRSPPGGWLACRAPTAALGAAVLGVL